MRAAEPQDPQRQHVFGWRSNWGNGMISHYPVVSHVAFLFIKRLENSTIGVDIGNFLGKTPRTNPCVENV